MSARALAGVSAACLSRSKARLLAALRGENGRLPRIQQFIQNLTRYGIAIISHHLRPDDDMVNTTLECLLEIRPQGARDTQAGYVRDHCILEAQRVFKRRAQVTIWSVAELPRTLRLGPARVMDAFYNTQPPVRSFEISVRLE